MTAMTTADETTIRRRRGRNATSTRKDVVRLALLSRGIILGGMIVSDILIPDHNPGDDVLRFDLRLNTRGAKKEPGPCFCLEGHACDDVAEAERRQRVRRKKNVALRNRSIGRECATTGDGSMLDFRHRQHNFSDGLFQAILSPITKWDGARFLSLAVDPSARKPTNGEESDGTFAKSEQAHAFLPLFPLCIRYGALFLVRLVPSILLPSTFEGVVALAALLISVAFFIGAAIALYDVTESLLRRSPERLKRSEVNKAAYFVAGLFCFNPASVFFTSSYSESMFADLTFSGYALAAQGSLIPWSLIPWSLATFARSNGTFSSIWILLVGCCKIVSRTIHEWSASANRDIPLIKKLARAVKRICPVVVLHAVMATVVAVPVLYHERRGYAFHCTDIPSTSDRPIWCDAAETSRTFSLYKHVQNEYWNVGFLKYYEIKQIPNFLLATPVLALGILAAICWIGTSWTGYLSAKKRKGNEYKQDAYIFMLLRWAVFAMNESVQTESQSMEEEQDVDVQEGDTPSVKIERALSAPCMLAHYAVLAGFCFVGATIAHVQISTRLICSSCPAFYWFLASLCFAGGESMKRRVKMYLVVFNVLGIVLHPNFLPWT